MEFEFPTTRQGVISLLWENQDWDFILGGRYDHQVVNVKSIELSATELVVIVVSVSLFRPEGQEETFTILPNGEYTCEVETFSTNKPSDYDMKVNPYRGWKDKIKLV